ncbi:MAG TPA: globin domain-containing protein [Nakamurella sp.]|nr:globin domain-containing protein [Nakamurella sp.]
MAEIDTAALKDNFAAVAARGGDDVALYFYSYLFLRFPQTRDMFPPGMTRQRDRLVGALVRIVTDVDDAGKLVPYLEDLGRDHRKFGTLSAHYPAVGEALLTTLRHFSGPDWTDKLATDWAAAYGIVAGTMSGAAEKVAATAPAYWDADILEVDRRTFDIAVLTARTETPVPYLAGQSLAVEPSDSRPREWRFFTPANPPGGVDIELHARLIPGGPVSTALVRVSKRGDKLRLGPPFGRMTLDPASQRPVLMVAGSTGVAPMKAMIGRLAETGGRRTHLYFGACSVREAYDQYALTAIDNRYGWLSVVTAISDDTRWKGRQGLIGEVAADDGDWSEHDVYVCGSPAMVEATIKRLLAVGVLEDRVRFEEFGEA